EGPDQVDLDYLGKGCQAVRPGFAEEPFRQPDSRASHRTMKTAKGFEGRPDGVLHAGLVCDIGLHETDPRAQLRGQALAAWTMQVGNRDVGTRVRQHADTGGAQSRAAAAHQERMALHLHDESSRPNCGPRITRITRMKKSIHVALYPWYPCDPWFAAFSRLAASDQ